MIRATPRKDPPKIVKLLQSCSGVITLKITNNLLLKLEPVHPVPYSNDLGPYKAVAITISSLYSGRSQEQGKWRDRSWQTRRTGNIASFKQGDDDDDQNTYNGNSTQQQ